MALQNFFEEDEKPNPTRDSRQSEEMIVAQNHTAKEFESTRELGGDSAHFLFGGRLSNGIRHDTK